MKRNLKTQMLLLVALLAGMGVMAQSIPIMEMPLNANPVANSNYGFGSSILPVVTEFKKDAFNNDNFSTYFPRTTFSVSLTNQQFTGLNYGTANYNGQGVSTVQTTGLVFGIAPSLASDPLPQGGNPLNRYDNMGAYNGSGPGGPINAMFTSSPTATGAELGTGLNVGAGTLSKKNGGVEVFTTAQALYGNNAYPVGSRVYFGDLILTFNYAVSNPVIHIAGLGGSYRYLPVGQPNFPANYVSTFFSTELELANTGVTSTLMSSNSYLSLVGNNILNNNDVNPNGGSRYDASEFIDNVGAATGSIRINGTVTQLVYKVYLQSGTGSQFAWSAPGSATGAPRDPFTGDIWYVSASFKEPVVQIISGTVFNDADGLTDGNISQSGSVTNPGTNAGGTLFANLLNSSGLVVASKPIDLNGAYLFDNVPVGTYSVQLTTNSSAGTYAAPLTAPPTALPAGWVNTGEFNGVGAGSDGSANGMSASIGIVSLDIKGDNNFGIERLPDTKPFSTLITTPIVGESITLNTPGAGRFGNLPILSGSDPEDQPTEGVLSGKSVQFTTLATVGSSNTPATLRYNGVAITLNQIISNFNAALLTVFLPNPWAGSGLKFSYAYVDAAGQADPTPALYQLRWSGGGTLVINLSEFVVTKNNCTANLNWKTSSEINSDRFEIEVSTGANPVYTTVSTVLASGSSSSTKAYQFNYQMQSGVTYYFRLKMIDKDGSFTYSNIQSANCSKGGGIVIAPNPVINMFTVKGMENGKNTIFVYAADGQLVKTQTSTTNNTVVNIANLAPGMYTVKVTSEAGNAVINKLIKY